MSFPSLADRLPPVRGQLVENAPLGPATWFRVGGPAQALFLPADEADLAAFLKNTPGDVPVTVLGAASNVIVRDGGVPGVVVRLGKPFAAIAVDGTTVTAGAAALDKRVAQAAAEAGVGGLAFYAGVPGTIGGALRMNAGCYGVETKDVLVSATALDRAGRRIEVSRDELGYAYRHSDAPDDWIFIAATFRGVADEPAQVLARMAEISAKREASQPIREKTGGSTFANPDPPGTENQRRSWVLIDEAGCRGLQIGGARMSELHANFMINTGDATAADLEALGEEVRRRVKAASGVDLRWEIKRIGAAAEAVAGKGSSAHD
jgi:UDP-N-acetylmuramate dehydrogenase